jgi:hypothetical protein
MGGSREDRASRSVSSPAVSPTSQGPRTREGVIDRASTRLFANATNRSKATRSDGNHRQPHGTHPRYEPLHRRRGGGRTRATVVAIRPGSHCRSSRSQPVAPSRSAPMGHFHLPPADSLHHVVVPGCGHPAKHRRGRFLSTSVVHRGKSRRPTRSVPLRSDKHQRCRR